MYFAVTRVQIPTYLHIPMGSFSVNFTTTSYIHTKVEMVSKKDAANVIQLI